MLSTRWFSWTSRSFAGPLAIEKGGRGSHRYCVRRDERRRLEVVARVSENAVGCADIMVHAAGIYPMAILEDDVARMEARDAV